jgi:type VI secretion system protein ImpA
MLSSDNLERLLNPVSESAPSGEDMEYDQDFIALENDAKPKAEQQFGDTIIAAVEPDWRDILNRSIEMTGRTKDARVAVLSLRAAARMQGLIGVSHGLKLLTQLMDKFWDTMHPKLDADDNNDPTMRINALAPLADTDTFLRDIHECQVGLSRGVGLIKVRDLLIASGKVNATSADPGYTTAQIEGALAEIVTENAEPLVVGAQLASQVQELQKLIDDKTGRSGLLDLKPLLVITQTVQQVCKQATQSPDTEADGSGEPGTAGSAGGAPRGEIATRQDALAMLDKVIVYLERTEPGNPAPLLIQRAKRLIGVSFLTIMEDLAPDALGSIQNITGRPPGSE